MRTLRQVKKDRIIKALPDVWRFQITETLNGYALLIYPNAAIPRIIDEAKTKEELTERWYDILVMHKLMENN